MRCGLKSLKVIIIPVTPLEQNCSLLFDPESEKGVIVDPGGDVEKIAAIVAQHNVTVEEIWLTHSHFDHCGGVSGCLAKWPAASLTGHPEEKLFRSRVPEIAGMWGLSGFEACPEPTRFVTGGEILSVGEFSCSVLFVPGHSPGHVAFYFADQGVLIAGDTLFCGSIGRTDLPLGDHGLLINSIKREILTLPDSVLVFPGHGPKTSVGSERKSNPYIAV